MSLIKNPFNDAVEFNCGGLFYCKGMFRLLTVLQSSSVVYADMFLLLMFS